jgi:CBS domain-containing protein
MSTVLVKDIMTRKVKTIDSTVSLDTAARSMARAKIGSVVVVEKSVPVGIITEGDISRAVARGLNVQKVTAGGVMKKRLVTVTQNMRLEDAAKTMAQEDVKKLPVVEDGRLVGIVTQTDIVASSFDLVNTLKELVRARYRPPDFE